ncbi:NPCBM/NEW2 domain-containing protein [Gimesia sp.]|uniref:NPCBM/NEW2 domain-containing protein n=1 Tax=Gimesia sp. TaxID=2024833 RepID=UPI0025BBF5BB|nr:NPCBM/NEW2 domain-containing protein [Gimesia sp.]
MSQLPAWQKKLLRPEDWQHLQSDYTSLQDAHAGGKSPHLDKYCLPPARLSLHDVGSIEASLPDMQWYIQQTLDHLARNETDEAMKFLGVLCHWNEDPGCPCAHSSPINEATLRRLLPPTAGLANKNYLFGYGGIADIGKYTLPEEPYRPQLLGTTIPEAAARIYQHQRLLRAHAAALIIPLVQAEIAGNADQADLHRQTAALYNAKHVADILYNLFCLQEKRFAIEEVEALKTQPLTAWEPDTKMQMISHPYYVTPFLINQSLDAGRKLHPLAFASEPETETTISHGIGMGTPYTLNYKIGPGSVFDRLTCRVGLHPTAGASGKVAFAIIVNGVVTAKTKFLTPADKPEVIDVSLPETDIVTLGLQTIPHPESNPLHNLAVWGEPDLIRAEHVPFRLDH